MPHVRAASNEVRRFTRVEHRVPVWIVSGSSGESVLDPHMATAFSCNVAMGGICLRSKIPLTCNYLHIKFQVPTGNYVTTACRVVRSLRISSNEWEYGLQFDKPLPANSLDFTETDKQEQLRLAVLTIKADER